MDDFYNIPVDSDPKHGLGLLASDSDTFQFPTLYGEFDHQQLLASDDPQSFYLAFPDAGVYGACDEVISRASTVVTPQSECSTRTTLSTRNISPSSDSVSFRDKPRPQEIEAMYHDTTQSIISGRQSRAASATWPITSNGAIGLNHALIPPTRPMPHRPQSFSYRPHQIPQPDNQTPPLPSSYFSSPNIQPQKTSSRSPFLSPSLQSPMMPQTSQLPNQDTFMQAVLTTNPSSYFAQTQSQPSPSQQQLQEMQFQRQLHLQLQQHQNLVQRSTLPTQPHAHAQMPALFPHHQLSSQAQTLQNYDHLPIGKTPSTISSTQSNNTPSLPNTTGNSSTGYQCFSHGCGGRHFSNWGNLVRHHRERQLRSKAGAKPTCPRCGKGFTRSSARDAHVAGLKCVLGRRRRGAGSTSNNVTTDTSTSDTGGMKSEKGAEEEAGDHVGGRDGADLAGDHDNGSDGSRDDDDNTADILLGEGEDLDDEMDLLGNREMIDCHTDNVGTRPAYLAPQQLQFQH